LTGSASDFAFITKRELETVVFIGSHVIETGFPTQLLHVLSNGILTVNLGIG